MQDRDPRDFICGKQLAPGAEEVVLGQGSVQAGVCFGNYTAYRNPGQRTHYCSRTGP